MFGPAQQFPGAQAPYFDSTFERANSINITAVKIMIPTLQTDVKIEQAPYINLWRIEFEGRLIIYYIYFSLFIIFLPH